MFWPRERVETLVIIKKTLFFYLIKFNEGKRQVTQVLPNSNGLIERHILDNLGRFYDH